jgi:hypothetical protein
MMYKTGESPHRGEPHGYRWTEARAMSNVTRLVILIRDSNAARLFVRRPSRSSLSSILRLSLPHAVLTKWCAPFNYQLWYPC